MAEKKSKTSKGRLLEFYGTECTFCIKMSPLVEKLEKEKKVNVEKIEVWHNAENAKFMQEVDKGFCGGVPFFFNEKTGAKICGAVSYDKLKEWAGVK
ncbi:hypothetical protein J4414_01565 [Candidatus Woesearchaeota archaeon]|nr:hypothetical protein [Candidatus Woesearchaeota archaeon]